MPINLEVIIDTEEYAVDMKSGLETLQGLSDSTRCIAETLVTGKVPQKQTANGSIRTNLKRTFQGSYGQMYGLIISDEALMREYNEIGNKVFAELMAYFMSESLYLDSEDLSDDAKIIYDKLGNNADNLIKQLRVSSMRKAHAVSIKFDYDVKLQCRLTQTTRVTIAKLNKNTVEALLARESRESVNINASITRLNINTGNGRLMLENEDDTVAFGFGSLYRSVGIRMKKNSPQT